MTSLQIARLCAQTADRKKGEKILLLDLREISSVADFFVIISGQSEPHLKAIRNEIELKVKEEGVHPRGIDGYPASQWIVMDYLDVLVHILSPRTREFYALELLWGDARNIPWETRS